MERALVNIRWFPYVIPDNMLSAGEESDEQTQAYRKKVNAEEANPASGAAGRPRNDGGAKADFRVRFGGDFCLGSRGYDYRGGCYGGSYGGGRR